MALAVDSAEQGNGTRSTIGFRERSARRDETADISFHAPNGNRRYGLGQQTSRRSTACGETDTAPASWSDKTRCRSTATECTAGSDRSATGDGTTAESRHTEVGHQFTSAGRVEPTDSAVQ